MLRLFLILLIVGGVVGVFYYGLWGNEVPENILQQEEKINIEEPEEDIVEILKQESNPISKLISAQGGSASGGNNIILNKNMEFQKIDGFHPEKDIILEEGKKYSAKIKTSAGDMLVELNSVEVPITVNNFVYLAKTGFYENVIFHRVIDSFMIQGGDPTGTGAGGPGYKFKDEEFSGEYVRGTLAMANAGPNTNGSQFFIMHADVALPPNYTIFGKVVDGLEVIDTIATAETLPGGEGSTPAQPVVIEGVEVIEK